MTRIKPVVLALDDDPDFRRSLEVVLARFGVIVKGVSQPQEFLDAAFRLRPDLYLVDLELGGPSGFDLIRELRRVADGDKPVVVLSGAKDRAGIARALECGANDYITKPLDRTLLASKLARYFDTEEIREHRSEMEPLPQGRVQATIALAAKVVGFDELGVTLRSASLIPKGTVFKLECAMFATLGAPDSRLLVSVTNNWVDAESGEYAHYAEFEGATPEFLERLRRWLTEAR